MVNRYIPPCEYTAEQITQALLQAVRDDETDSIKEGLIGLLMFHYPDDFATLDLASRLAHDTTATQLDETAT